MLLIKAVNYTKCLFFNRINNNMNKIFCLNSKKFIHLSVERKQNTSSKQTINKVINKPFIETFFDLSKV